ncbi:MAG: hypothetical protein Q8R00_00855 [Candidatus Nanoarchaeia archaeon]|nr:hypothetical protein [Candidatus Nanoarchaeia archaeon]
MAGTFAGTFSEASVAIISPLQAIWIKTIESLPNLVAAVIVLIIGAFVAVILGHALRVILEKLKLDDYVRKAKLTKAIGHTNLSSIFGELFKWYIIILFLQQSVALISLGTLSVLLDTFVRWLPSVIIAAVVLLFGLAVAHYIEMAITEHSKVKGVRFGAAALKWTVITIVFIIALKQIGVQVTLLENAVLLVLGSLVAGFALAFGISLGLGMKKEGADMIKNIKKGF